MKWLYAAGLAILLCGSSLAQHIKLNGRLITDQKIPVRNTGISVAGRQAGLTDANGRFSIELSSDLKEGERVIINVHKPGWVINYPLDGEWNLPNIGLQNIQTLDVIIVPRGSKALWTHARIEREIEKLLDRATMSQRDGNRPTNTDFTQYMLELAKKYGSTPRETTAVFDEWAKAVEKTANYHVKGLVDFYNQSFASAAENFKKAALNGEENVFEEWKLAGNSAFFAYGFREALESYGRALNLVSRAESPEKWAEVTRRIGNAKERLGIQTGGEGGLQLLVESEMSFRYILPIFTRERFPQKWAETQNNLGIALHNRAITSEGEERDRLLNEAIAASRQALQVFTRQQSPKDWASTQNNLGAALEQQARTTEGENRIALLKESMAAYQQALLVYTREQMPEQWASTQNNVGLLLEAQGTYAEGSEGERLLNEAVATYRQALAVQSRDRLPQEWALTRSNLGNALQALGIRAEGHESLRLLNEAVAEYRQALSVRTRERLPQDWAITLLGLGGALQELGIRAEGQEGVRLLNEAVTAYRQALLVRTREQMPQQWAAIQNKLGMALRAQGMKAERQEGLRLFKEAVAAYRQALLVLTREQTPEAWARTQNNLGNALADQAERTEGQEGKRLLGEAVIAYQLALLVYTWEQRPWHWRTTQDNLARALLLLEEWANAAQRYESLLKVDSDYRLAYERAIFLEHDVLFNYQRAFELNDSWLRKHPDDLSALSEFAEKHFTTSKFEESRQRISSLLTNEKVDVTVRIALRAIEIADLMALNKSNEVPLRMKTLIELVGSQPADFKVEWSFEGTKHFIDHTKELASNKDWLLRLFVAMERENRDAIVVGLKVASESTISK